ncbi:hypothetical protein NBRC116494_28480 [Aurantivibrio plasticivorans]
METDKISISMNLPNVELRVLNYGGPEDAPVIFLIHGLGLTSNATVWDWVAPMLTQDYQVFAIDMRGHGQSSLPADEDFSFGAITNDIHLAQKLLGFSTVLCVGHSWGADIALQYAVNFPDAVKGAIAIDGGVLGLNKVMTWDQANVVFEPPRWQGMKMKTFQESVMETFLETRHQEQQAEDFHQLFDIIMGSFRRNQNGSIEPVMSYENQLRAMKYMFEQACDDVYSRVRCPTLFISCNPPQPIDDMTSRYIAWRDTTLDVVVGAKANRRRMVIDGAIHDVILQKPAEVAAHIKMFSGKRR